MAQIILVYDIIPLWNNVLFVISRLINVSAALNEGMYAPWIWGSHIVLSASLIQKKCLR